MIRTAGLTLSVSLLLMPSLALARATEHFYSVEEAVQSSLGKQKLLDVSYYFEGQKHPTPKSVIGKWSSNRSTRGAFRSDAESCQVAFLSALIALQERAAEEGGNAIIGIQSITRGKTTSSPNQYRCVAGATVVHVGLEGQVVKLK